MTPKEKAEMLVDEYNQLLGEYIFNGHFDIAKECALITVNELIDETDMDELKYYRKVKQEIEKL